MNYSKDFSVIVPTWRGAIKYLPKLFESIPDTERIEIIVVDNSKEPVRRNEIDCSREIVLLHSAPERHAGGSRNEGMAVAKGRWLLFADSDDYYAEDAFDVYNSMLNTEAEIVYTGMGGVFMDTGEPSTRGERYIKAVHDYLNGNLSEMQLRLGFSSPCCKMVSHDLVLRHNLKYDEVVACNDMFFSMLSGYYAKTITAVDKITYIATVSRGSLTRRHDYVVSISRLKVRLRYNQFLREHALSDYQGSIMNELKDVCGCGLKAAAEGFKLVARYKQNPFIGYKRWIKSYKNIVENKKIEKQHLE